MSVNMCRATFCYACEPLSRDTLRTHIDKVRHSAASQAVETALTRKEKENYKRNSAHLCSRPSVSLSPSLLSLTLPLSHPLSLSLSVYTGCHWTDKPYTHERGERGCTRDVHYCFLFLLYCVGVWGCGGDRVYPKGDVIGERKKPPTISTLSTPYVPCIGLPQKGVGQYLWCYIYIYIYIYI